MISYATNIRNLHPSGQVALKNAYVEYLDTIPWTFFFTGTTRYDLTLKSARRLADRWYDAIKVTGESLFFWVAEPHELKDGHHLHGLLKYPPVRFGFERLYDTWQWATGNTVVPNKESKLKWNKATHNYVHLKDFDPKLNASGYCAKYILKQHSDYDLLF